LIIEAFGFDQFKTILFNIPFGAVQLIATMGGAWLATAWKMKGPVIALLCLPAIAGCVMLLELPRDGSNNGALLAGYYIVSHVRCVCSYNFANERQDLCISRN
jgi:hypothetical protein